MSRRIVWLIVSGLLVAALLLSACGPAVIEKEKAEEEEKEEVVVEKKAAEKFVWLDQGGWVRPEFVDDVEEVAPGMYMVWPPSLEEPQYGGILNDYITSDPRSFDPYTAYGKRGIQHEHLNYRDPYTTFEQHPGTHNAPIEYRLGWLAESWTIPDPQTIIFTLRKGIKFNSGLPKARALVGDREFVADDVVYCYSRWLGLHGMPKSASQMVGIENADAVVALDKYTVEIHSSLVSAQFFNSASCMASSMIYPREVVDKYGDYNDWTMQVGTGPFYLKSYVPASSLTYVKNEEYWATGEDVYGKAYTLPFLDGIKELIIPDNSTQQAALRTGKIDTMGGIRWDEVEGFARTNPELLHLERNPTGSCVHMRKDKAPWDNLKVRQALSMAIDRKAIVNDLYKGYAAEYSWPAVPQWGEWVAPKDMPKEPTVKALEGCNHLLEDSTVSLYEIFNYDPVESPKKARQLLDEALGVGVEHTWQITTYATYTYIDALMAVMEYWAAIGMHASLDLKESAVVTTMRYAQTYPDMATAGGGQVSTVRVASYDYWGGVEPLAAYNCSCTRDVRFDAMIDEINRGPWTYEEEVQLGQEMNIYFQESVIRIILPGANSYHYQQPWVKGGYWGQSWCCCGPGSMYRFLWIDQELKGFIKARY